MSGCGPRLLIGLVMVIGTVFMYLRTPKEFNPVTGKEQRLALNMKEEVQLGLQSAPKMAQQFGGRSADQRAAAKVEEVGQRVAANSRARQMPYRYNFHLLADNKTVNAFALPGGQIFITEALFRRLETEDMLAGVLGHEIGHVVGRHSAAQISKQKLTQGITMAAVLAGSGESGGAASGQLAQMIGNMVNMKYGRGDELEADRLGVLFMNEAGYKPEALIQVMKVLEEASGGRSGPEYMNSHPNPGNRAEKIAELIKRIRNQEDVAPENSAAATSSY